MKKAVLAVDDSRTVLNMLELYLKDRYELFCTTSGHQALQILQKQTIDIVLLDFMMPVMNGMMVLKKIRERKDSKDIPVLFLTSDAHRATVVESYQMGSQGYILKPVAKDDLQKRIEETLQKQEKFILKKKEEDEKAQEAKKLLEAQKAEEERKLSEAKKTGEQKKLSEDTGKLKAPDISRDLQVRQAEAELEEDSLLGAFEDMGDILENFVKEDDDMR